MIKFRLLIALILPLVVCGSCTPLQKKEPPPGPPHRVLFIGGNDTSDNGGIANALNRLSNGLLICEASTSADRSLAWHWTQGNAVQALGSAAWDDVVLQEDPRQILEKPEIFTLFVRRFDDQIHRAGARTVLFMTWAPTYRAGGGAAIFHSNEAAGASVGATLAPVGVAWERALKERPSLALDGKNGSRLPPAATYLAACVFYKTLLDRTPVGLPSFVIDGGGNAVIALPPEDAKFCQEVAEKVVMEEKSPHDEDLEKMGEKKK